MRKMILDEVIRFRHNVRRQPIPSSYGQQQPDVKVGVPEGHWPNDAPRPQEAQDVHGQGTLENELAYGLDAMQH